MGNATSIKSESYESSMTDDFANRSERFQCFVQIGYFSRYGRILLAHDKDALLADRLRVVRRVIDRNSGHEKKEKFIVYMYPWAYVRTEMKRSNEEELEFRPYDVNNTYHLRKEAYVLSFFEGVESFPQVYFHKIEKHNGKDYIVLITTLVGPSLRNIFDTYLSYLHQRNKVSGALNFLDTNIGMSPKHIGRIVREMLDRIREFHDNGFIHCALSLDCFHYGAYPRHQHKLLLTNYSYAQRFRRDHKDSETKLQKVFLTDPFFASPYILQQWIPGRRDDMISIAYIAIYLKMGYLPWDPSSLLSLKNEKEELLIASRTIKYTEELSAANRSKKDEIDFIKSLLFYTTETSLIVKELFNKYVQMTTLELDGKIEQNLFAQVCVKKYREEAYVKLQEISPESLEHSGKFDRFEYIEQRRELFNVLMDITSRIEDRDPMNLAIGALTELTAREVISMRMQTKEDLNTLFELLTKIQEQYQQFGFELMSLFLTIHRKFVIPLKENRLKNEKKSGESNNADGKNEATKDIKRSISQSKKTMITSGAKAIIDDDELNKRIHRWEDVFDQNIKEEFGFIYKEQNEQLILTPPETIIGPMRDAIAEVSGEKEIYQTLPSQSKLKINTELWSPEEKDEFLKKHSGLFLSQQQESRLIEEEKERVLSLLLRDEAFLRACRPFTTLDSAMKEFLKICYNLGRDDVPKYKDLYDLTFHWDNLRKEFDKGHIYTEEYHQRKMKPRKGVKHGSRQKKSYFGKRNLRGNSVAMGSSNKSNTNESQNTTSSDDDWTSDDEESYEKNFRNLWRGMCSPENIVDSIMEKLSEHYSNH